MNVVPFIAIWSFFGVVTLGLALYRKILTFHGDGAFVHLADSEERLIPQQVALGNKLDAIDRWGKSLTVFTVTLGVIIAAVFLVEAWRASLLLK
jgi:ABC-type transport system involved in cytochrome c biogenesis permease subunit